MLDAQGSLRSLRASRAQVSRDSGSHSMSSSQGVALSASVSYRDAPVSRGSISKAGFSASTREDATSDAVSDTKSNSKQD